MQARVDDVEINQGDLMKTLSRQIILAYMCVKCIIAWLKMLSVCADLTAELFGLCCCVNGNLLKTHCHHQLYLLKYNMYTLWAFCCLCIIYNNRCTYTIGNKYT